MSLRSLARDAVMRAAVLAGRDARQRRRDASAEGPPRVRVMNLHGTPWSQRDAFRRQLEWVCEHFRVIDFPTLSRWWDEPSTPLEPDTRPAVLLSFDDGFANNHAVAAEVLEEFGAHGLFFVVAGFCEQKGESAWRFYREHIRSGSVEDTLPADEWKPLRPDQVADLAARGHTIGNHTFSHARLSELDAAAARAEIERGAERLEEWTRAPVESFAWTFAWDAIGPEAWAAATQRHAFCFAPCPGQARPGRDPATLIWRTNVEPAVPRHEYRFLYSGLADSSWAARRDRLRRTLLDAAASA